MVSAILGTAIPSSALERVAQAPDRNQVAEVELLTPVFVGQRIPDLRLEGCEVVALRRNNLWVDDIEVAELRRSDVLTLVGAKAAINKVRESLRRYSFLDCIKTVYSPSKSFKGDRMKFRLLKFVLVAGSLFLFTAQRLPKVPVEFHHRLSLLRLQRQFCTASNGRSKEGRGLR